MKKILVNVKSLKEWMQNEGIDYRQLAERTGMSVTQAFNLTRKPNAGAVTMAYLVDLNIPGLFYVAEFGVSGRKRFVKDVHRLSVKVSS